MDNQKEIFIVFQSNDDIVATVKINPQDIDGIIFNYESVKEINFFKFVETIEDNRLDSLYNILNNINLDSITAAYIMQDENCFYGYKLPVKAILYRTQAYVQNQVDLKLKENLSIRFEEDNIYDIDSDTDLVTCNAECKYCNINKCTKYNLNLQFTSDNKPIICKSCFLEIEHTFKKTILSEMYQNMIKMYTINEDE